jgi:type I restriction enzyme S subunit
MKVHELSGSEDLISKTALQEGRVSLLPAGAVLIVTRSGILSHSLPVAVTKVPVTINQDIKALVPHKDVCPRYVAHALRGASQRILKTCSKHGTTVASVETAALLDFEIPLLPLDEQRKVVAEIEKQLSRLDEAVANLQRVKANLKRYKASVLKDAVEGRLVESEASIAQREGHSYESAHELIEKTQTPPRPNRFNSRTGDVILGHSALAVGIPPTSVPEGWKWVNLVEIAKMESGHTPSRSNPEWWGGDVPWIGIADARDHHERSILNTIQHTNSDGLANSAARLLPAGTVCVSRTASVGYVVVMGKPMATSQDFVNWVPTSAVISDWLRVVFTADRDALIRFGKGSVHKTIYFPEWLSASIALPPVAEQARIAAEVDRHLSIISEVESEVDANLRRTQALRQATLANKFSAS